VPNSSNGESVAADGSRFRPGADIDPRFHVPVLTDFFTATDVLTTEENA
jgi:hypothetical protein